MALSPILAGKQLTMRSVLYLGFGLILVAWTIAGAGVLWEVAQIRQQVYSTNARFNERQEQLFALRAEVLLGSVYLRDALLDLRSDSDYRTILQDWRRSLDRWLDRNEPARMPALEEKAWTLLRQELHEYAQALAVVGSWPAQRRAGEGPAYLRRVVIPKRDVILDISERTLTLNRLALGRHRDEINGLYLRFRNRVQWTIGLGIALAVGVCLLVSLQMLALERTIRRQHQQLAERGEALQRLSARLIHRQEEERRSIAHELHDEIGQAMTAIKMNLGALERNFPGPPPALELIREARSIADHTLQAARDLSQMLHPAMLDQLGLTEAVQWYVTGFSQRTGIQVTATLDNWDRRLAQEIEVTAYRTVQEALTNIARHSRATRCQVSLQRLPQILKITVDDNGCGFEPEGVALDASGRGLGLIGIEERVAGVGGTFRVESAPGSGSRLTVEIPAQETVLPAEDAETETAAAESGLRAPEEAV
jgi:signal transduction histidine kinase